MWQLYLYSTWLQPSAFSIVYPLEGQFFTFLFPFAPFKQSCIRVFLVFLVCLTRYERMVLEMALGADLHRVSPTDKRFVFYVSRRHLVNRWAIGCCVETVKSWVRCNKCIQGCSEQLFLLVT